MFGRSKLKREILRLRYRVADLEERLCPCEGHDWVRIAAETTVGVCGPERICTYKCRRCGKTKIQYEE